MHVAPTISSSSLVQRICRCWINNAYNSIIMSDTNTTNQGNLRFIKKLCQQGHTTVELKEIVSGMTTTASATTNDHTRMLSEATDSNNNANAFQVQLTCGVSAGAKKALVTFKYQLAESIKKS